MVYLSSRHSGLSDGALNVAFREGLPFNSSALLLSLGPPQVCHFLSVHFDILERASVILQLPTHTKKPINNPLGIIRYQPNSVTPSLSKLVLSHHIHRTQWVTVMVNLLKRRVGFLRARRVSVWFHNIPYLAVSDCFYSQFWRF